MAIKMGDKVKVHYTGRLSDGSEFDSSRDRAPLEFTLGTNSIIPGFENALVGHEAGDKITVVIPPKDAYGDADPELVFTVSRAEVPSSIPLKVGTALQLSSEDQKGVVMDVVITEVGPEEITLDANHPLAGKELTFDIDVVEHNVPA